MNSKESSNYKIIPNLIKKIENSKSIENKIPQNSQITKVIDQQKITDMPFTKKQQKKLKIEFRQIKKCKTKYSLKNCLLYTSPSPRDLSTSRMPSSA